MAARRVPFVTPEEYLAHERGAAIKSEYIAGEVFAMAGGSPEHSALATDVQVPLAVALRGKPCEVYNSDLKVRVSDAGPFFYPDITVVCGEPQIDFDDCLRNPTVVIEVASESTSSYDRGGKFVYYRRFPSLQHFVVIEQAEVFVEHWECDDSGKWHLTAEHTALTDYLSLTSLSIAVPLAEIYRRIPSSRR